MTLALTALLVGLFSGVHCMAMCGGIVGALGMQRTSPALRVHGGAAALRADAGPLLAALPMQLAYSVGRIASYAAAGALAGSVGGMALLAGSLLPVQAGLAVLASALLLLLALHLVGIGHWVARLEGWGVPLWRRIAPLARRFLPAATPAHALAVGAAWGWLPCGLVYSTLALALVGGSATQGALIMAAFGLGTLPNLLAAGLVMHHLRPWLARASVRRLAASAVAVLALASLVRIPGAREMIGNGLLCFS